VCLLLEQLISLQHASNGHRDLPLTDVLLSCIFVQTPTATLTAPVHGGPNAAAWDPHHARQLLSADGGNLRQYDLRSGVSPVSSIDHAHEDEIRDVDYNPNKPFHVLSAGCDRRVRIWDLRSPGTPLKVLQGHSHWTCMARFNRFHDQLVLSAGTERVNLWNILSLSSAPIGELEQSATDKTGAPAAQDSLIKTFSDHEDSLNAVAWSSHDAWIFASLSYDGRVVVNHVPPAEKYRILL
jgi:WD40 repeat protein